MDAIIESTERKETGNDVINAQTVVTVESESGDYIHNFKKPFVWEGKTYKSLTFDFENLTGQDCVDVENEMSSSGKFVIAQEMSDECLAKIAARAAGVGDDVIIHLPIREFKKVIGKTRAFLTTGG